MENSLTRTIIIVAETAIIAFIMTIAIIAFRQSGEITKAQDGIISQYDTRIHGDDLIRYSGTTMKGSDVLNVIKENRASNAAFVVEKSSGTETVYNFTDTGLSEKVSDVDFATSIEKARDPENASYIRPVGTYTCTVKENDITRAVEAVIFTET